MVARPAFGLKAYDVRHIPVLAASSPEFGRLSAEQMAQKMNERADSEHEVKRRESERPSAEVQPELFVAPGGGHCVKSHIDLVERQFPQVPGKRIGAYVKGTTDGTGRVLSLTVLFTRDPEWSNEIVAFGLRHLRVYSPDVPGFPLELYGALMVSAKGQAGYLIGGVLANASRDDLPDIGSR